MHIAIVPALLLGLGARILFDHFSRFDGPSLVDFILFGAWQGVALHYATKAGFGVIVAFGSATKLFIELNFIFDVARFVTILVGISLGVLFTDFLYQHFEKPPPRRKKHKSAPMQSESLVKSRPRVTVETIIDPAPNPHVLSNIAPIDSGLGFSPSLSERKWAVSQGDIAREAELKAIDSEVSSTNSPSHHQEDHELTAPSSREEVDQLKSQTPPEFWEAELKAMEVFTDTHHQDDQEPTASSSREEGDQLKIQTPPEYCEAELKTTEAVSTNSHHKEDQEQKASSSGDKGKQSEKTHPEYGLVIGIDLGTTYSCVGVYKGGRVEIISDGQGNRIIPSWVGFYGDERLIGDSAKNSFHSNPKNTVFDAKRLIGCTIEEVKRDLEHLPFTVKEKNGAPVISVTYEGKTREFAPEEISAMILTKIREIAEAYLGHGVTHAVVTVPSHFNNAQRQATKNAGEIAGLKVLRVVNDPIATALARGRDKTGSESKIIVYDLGGGSFDVSLFSIDGGDFKVLATAGDTRLGGEDFNNRVIDYLIKDYNKKTGTDVSSNQRAMSKLRKAVELAKRTLSMQLSAKIEIENFENGNRFLKTLTRAKFEELNLELFERTMKLVKQVLKDAKVMKSEIDEVIMVGGSTKIPKIQELLKDFFGKEPSTNPDETVVTGATIQAAILSGQVDGITVLDVNSLTLGIEVNGGAFAPIIKRNTAIPTKKSQIFSTAIDKQTTVMIKVFEGDRDQTKFNHLLGEFKLVGIPRAPKGVPQVEVTYELDANSILTVRALDKRTGNSKLMVVTTEDKRILSQEAINRLAKGEKYTPKDLRHEKWRDRGGVRRIGN